MREAWRLFDAGDQEGAEAMAMDDLWLEEIRPGDCPILHLWRWARNTVSIGYAQPLAILATARVEAAQLPVVRRPTGGKAVLHVDDLSYACIVPRPYRDWERGQRPPYEFIAAAIETALRAAGVACAPPPRSQHPNAAREVVSCSAEVYPHELVAGPAKILGSAQRRLAQGILIQGTITPAGPARLDALLAGSSDPLPLLKRPPRAQLDAVHVISAFAARHDIQFKPWSPGDAEIAAVAERVRTRFDNRAWTARQ